HFGKHQVVHIRDGSALEMGEIIFQRLLHTAAQGRLTLFDGRVQVLFQVGLLTHGCCSTQKGLGHRCHAATSSSASIRAAKNSRMLARCASVLSKRLNRARNSLAPGSVARYQPTCLRAMRTPMTSP